MTRKLNYVLLSCLLFVHTIFAATSITLTQRQLCDLELLLNGGFAPLQGFMNERDYNGVVENMHLANGSLWPMPITLDVTEKTVQALAADKNVELRSPEGVLLATMNVEDVWKPNKLKEVEFVYGTKNTEHPGADYILNKTNEYYMGGKVTLVSMPKHYDFTDLRRTPQDLKKYFKDNNITKVIAFQTRNPMHRAHQELTFRAAKETGAHLLLHPAVGLTKPGDVDYFTRVHCYKALLKYYPEKSVTLSLLPIAMRMAGPREALWHALIRKNYGCTHFIVGRDHAGPGSDSTGKPFYGPYDAQQLVLKYAKEAGITPVPFNEVVYLPEQDTYQEVDKIAPGTKTLSISGTQLRKMLRDGSELPTWFTFPEVALELRKSYPPRNKQGFTLFFTGLSGAGKSTVANALAVKLMEIQDRNITMLDGDIVRTYLSSELGFSKEHRSLNVRRVGFVANEISKNGGIAMCALIAPYAQDRQHNRDLINTQAGYIEVYISTSLAECEKRDLKGLYAKARQGIIPNFTGISDPYEAPKSAELVIDTAGKSVEDSVNMILDYLKKEGYIS